MELLHHQNPIRAYRLDRGLSVAELGAAIGIGRAAMVMVESGDRLITQAQQITLARQLRIDPAKIDYAVDHAAK